MLLYCVTGDGMIALAVTNNTEKSRGNFREPDKQAPVSTERAQQEHGVRFPLRRTYFDLAGLWRTKERPEYFMDRSKQRDHRHGVLRLRTDHNAMSDVASFHVLYRWVRNAEAA